MQTVENVPWTEFRKRFVWKQGEHLTALAPTGAGKTTLFSELEPYRRTGIFFGTKITDTLYQRLMRRGYRRIGSIDELKSSDLKVMLWPKMTEKTIREFRTKQKQVFQDAIDFVAKKGKWTVWFDEAKYMNQMLGLGSDMTFCYEQLRSAKGTIISGSQRPAWLPVSALSNATHVFMWNIPQGDDQKRLADIGGVSARELSELTRTLGEHEFLYIHTRGTRTDMLRSQTPAR